MNEKFEKYLKDLSPELQEKARACRTIDELSDFAAENDIELSDDLLKAVAGGIYDRDPQPGGGCFS